MYVPKDAPDSEDAARDVDRDGDDDEQSKLSGNVEGLTQKVEEVHHLKKDRMQALTSIQELRKDVTEEGKETPVKRLKNLDMLVNNLNTQVFSDDKAPLAQRLSQLAQDLIAAQEDLEKTSSSAQPHMGSAPSSVNVGPLNARLEHVEKELQGLPDEQEGRDKLTEEEISTQVGPLEEQIDAVDADRVKDVKKVEFALAAVDTRFQGVSTALGSKASQEALNL